MKRYLHTLPVRLSALIAAALVLFCTVAIASAVATTMPAPQGHHLVPGNPPTTPSSHAILGVVLAMIAILAAISVIIAWNRVERPLVAVPASLNEARQGQSPDEQASQGRKAA